MIAQLQPTSAWKRLEAQQRRFADASPPDTLIVSIDCAQVAPFPWEDWAEKSLFLEFPAAHFASGESNDLAQAVQFAVETVGVSRVLMVGAAPTRSMKRPLPRELGMLDRLGASRAELGRSKQQFADACQFIGDDQVVSNAARRGELEVVALFYLAESGATLRYEVSEGVFTILGNGSSQTANHAHRLT